MRLAERGEKEFEVIFCKVTKAYDVGEQSNKSYIRLADTRVSRLTGTVLVAIWGTSSFEY